MSFHLGSVFLHAACSASVVALGCALPCAPQGSGAGSLEHVRLAALLFAVHPVHAETVAGIVGQADALACLFFCFALALYARGLYSTWQWGALLVCLAFALAMLATLAKEVGASVVGCFVALDWLLPLHSRAAGEGRWRTWLPKLARLALSGGFVFAYVHLRGLLMGGDHLVPMIYDRKVENPLPFLGGAARFLTTLYIQARYVGLLLLPLHLSADWSHACLGTVDDVLDPRNLLSAALYLGTAFVAFRARPWCFSWRRAGFSGPLLWRVASFYFVLGALPFLPASNIFFPVGTFIGERLLYLPSVGFCLLAALGLLRLPKGGCRRALVGGLLAVCAARTWVQVAVWRDASSLWESAERTCPRSAKVQSQLGILAQNEGRHRDALRHSSLAQEIEPTYCDPTYNIALARWSQSDQLLPALDAFREALQCKWTRPAAYQNLGRIVKHMLKREPRNGLWLEVAGDLQLAAHGGPAAAASYFAAAESYWLAGDLNRALTVAKRGSVLRRGAGPDACPRMRPRHRPGRMLSEGDEYEVEWELRSRRCFALQSSVVSGLGAAPASDKRGAGKGLIGRYVEDNLAACRDSYGHYVAVHLMLAVEPENPVLQREWGELMLQQGESSAAVEHLHASALLFLESQELGEDGALESLRRLSELDQSLACALAAQALALAAVPSRSVESLSFARLRERWACAEEGGKGMEARVLRETRASAATDAI